ncbi:kinase-like domain-containing protein, partial [Mycena vulgaris]
FVGQHILVKQVFLKLIDAVRFCHERGIHHRDLKPENILCSQDATNVRVADFGMALDEELPCSVAGRSNSYMTPESLTLGRGTETFEAYQSDVWALYIVLLNIISVARASCSAVVNSV